MRGGQTADQRENDEWLGFEGNGIIDRILLSGVREREKIKRTMDYGSQCASSAEFIVSLQGQPRKLSDKKINRILLDPYKCG